MPRSGVAIPLLALALALLACDAPQPRPLRVGLNVWPGYEPLLIARDEGLLPESEVQLVECVAADQVRRALRVGAIDVGALTIDEALLLVAETEELELEVVLALDDSSGADAILGAPDVTSLAALRGRPLGLEHGGVSGYVLARAAELHGLRAEELTILATPWSDHAGALRSGRVAAIVTHEPAVTTLRREGYPLLFSSRELPGEVLDLLVMRLPATPENVARLPLLDRAYASGAERITQSQTPPSDATMRRLGLDEPALREALAGLRLLRGEEEARIRAAIPEQLERTAATLRRTGLIPADAHPEARVRVRAP